MITAGIDAAAQPKATAACLIEWEPGRTVVSELRTGLDDEALLELIARADKVGMDAPFGWPDDFADAIAAHRDRSGWPDTGADQDAYRFRLRFRETDRRLIKSGHRPPLSVSTDWIGVVTMRMAYLFEQLAERGEPVDRAGAGKLCEVYPAPALRDWGLNVTGYKARAGSSRLPFLLGELERGLGGLQFADEAHRALAEAEHDAFDALVSALIARAAALGLTTPPEPGEEAERAAREGWIHLPTNPLEALPQQRGRG